jgi:hypothetical protein
MQAVLDDLVNSSLDDVFKTDAQNRAWSRELRGKASELVNNRLAARISLEEYAASRKHVNEEIAECKRRSLVLSDEIEKRRARLARGPRLGAPSANSNHGDQ